MKNADGIFLVICIQWIMMVPCSDAFLVNRFINTRKLVPSMTRLNMNAADAWNQPAFGSGAGGSSSGSGSGGGGSAGALETIEFKIYPDGRVEESVRGIKGNNCHTVTEKINEKLGKVIETRPTEEMFEQDITISENIQISAGNNNNNVGGWDGSSSW